MVSLCRLIDMRLAYYFLALSIALQSERERAKAELDFERRQADEAARVEEERTKRKDLRDEQLADLEDATQERYNALVESLQKEHDLTKEQLDATINLWKDAYGPDGEIVKWVDQGVAIVEARILHLAQLMNRLRTSMGTVPDPIRTEKDLSNYVDEIRKEKEFDFAGGQAEGGTIVARKPTVAIFGEAGPEMATFTPLNKLGTNAPRITPANAGQMTRSGRLRLELLLSPDLEAKIIDDTLGEIADVNFTIERARK